MTTINQGFTFVDAVTDQVTSSALHTHIEGATIEDIANADFDGAALLVQVDSSLPSTTQTFGAIWYDTTQEIAFQNQGGRWDGMFDHTQAVAAVPLNLGDVVHISGLSGSIPIVSPLASLAHSEVLGVTSDTMASGATGWIRKYGWAPVRISTSVAPSAMTAGDTLISSSVTGAAVSSAVLSAIGQFTTGIVFGQCFKEISNDATPTLVTCLLSL